MSRFVFDPRTGLMVPSRRVERVGKRLCSVGAVGPTFFDPAGGPDPFWTSVKLLLNPTGALGSTSYTDLSNSPQTISLGSSPPQQNGFGLMTFTGAAGCYLNGTAAKMAAGGNNPVCIEAFVNPSSVAATIVLFSQYTGGAETGIDPTGQVYGQVSAGSGSSANGAIGAGTLVHVAMQYSGTGGTNGPVSTYVGGVRKQGASGNLSNSAAGTTWTIGARDSTKALRWTGTMGAIRITFAQRYANVGTLAVPGAFPTS